MDSQLSSPEARVDHLPSLREDLARALGAREDGAALRGARAVLARLDPRLEVVQVGDGEGTLAIDSRLAPTRRPLLDRLIGHRLSLHRPALLPRVPPRPAERLPPELAAARVRVGFIRGHLLSAVVFLPGCPAAGDEAALADAEEALFFVLGEQVFDDWIGEVTVSPLPGRGRLRVLGAATAASPLREVAAAVRAAVAGVHAGLDPTPFSCRSDEAWTVFELEPRCEGVARQADLLTAATTLPELLKSWLSGARFASCRFGARGERFYQLALPHGELRGADILERRERVERALDGHLRAERGGAVFGHGLGTRAAYLHFVRERPDELWDPLLEALRCSGAPRGTWLGPLDDDLEDEVVTLTS